MCAQLHFNTYKDIGVKLDKKHWYEHVPISVETSHESKVMILWNQQLKLTVSNNKLDIITLNNKREYAC